MKRNAWLSIALVPILVSGCASSPDAKSELEQAKAQYKQMEANEQIRANAATELLKADTALKDAEQAKNKTEREQDLYLARQHMAIAGTVAQRKVLDKQIQALNEQASVQAELAALEAKRTSRGYTVPLPDVYFKTGQASLPSGAEGSISRLASFLREHPKQNAIVQGYTDNTGSAASNERLSEQRARAVKDAIVAHGISPARIQTKGYGESQPIASNQNAGGRQLNRRVEILLPGAGLAGAG